MKNKNVLMVSVIAVLVATGARADIASTTYVDNKVQPATTHIADSTIHVTAADKTAWNAKVDSAQGSGNKDKVMITNNTDGTVTSTKFVHYSSENGSNVYSASATDKDTTIPSVRVVEAIANTAAGALYVPLDQGDNTNKAMITDNTGEVVAGLITNQHIASGAAIDPGKIATDASNRFVSDTEKSTWNGKQAALGGNSHKGQVVTTSASDGSVTYTDIDTTSGGTANSAKLITSGAVNAGLAGKQATISDLTTIRSNASAGAGAATTIAGYGDIVTHNASEFQAAGSYVPTTRTVNGNALSSDVTLTGSSVDIATGYAPASSAAAVAAGDSLDVAIGKLEKQISGKQAAGSYVPTDRTVNGKALSSNITLSASDVSAVPTTRKVNGNALSSDVTLTGGNVNVADGYAPAATAAAVAAGDSLNTAIGKLEKQIAGKQATIPANTYDAAGTASGLINALDSDLGTGNVTSGANVVTEVVQTNGKVTVTHGKAVNAVAEATGGGNVVTAVTLNSDGKTINVTKGTTLGSLATKSSVAKTDLASGVQTSLGYADDWNTTKATYGNIVTHNASEFQVAGNYITVPAASGTGKSVLTYDGTANSGAGAYYWEDIGR